MRKTALMLLISLVLLSSLMLVIPTVRANTNAFKDSKYLDSFATDGTYMYVREGSPVNHDIVKVDLSTMQVVSYFDGAISHSSNAMQSCLIRGTGQLYQAYVSASGRDGLIGINTASMTQESLWTANYTFGYQYSYTSIGTDLFVVQDWEGTNTPTTHGMYLFKFDTTTNLNPVEPISLVNYASQPNNDVRFVTNDGSFIYVGISQYSPVNSTVLKIDPASMTVAGTIALPEIVGWQAAVIGTNLYFALSPDGSTDSNNIVKVDLNTFTLSHTYSFSFLNDVVGDGTYLYLDSSTNGLVKVDPSTMSIVGYYVDNPQVGYAYETYCYDGYYYSLYWDGATQSVQIYVLSTGDFQPTYPQASQGINGYAPDNAQLLWQTDFSEPLAQNWQQAELSGNSSVVNSAGSLELYAQGTGSDFGGISYVNYTNIDIPTNELWISFDINVHHFDNSGAISDNIFYTAGQNVTGNFNYRTDFQIRVANQSCYVSCDYMGNDVDSQSIINPGDGNQYIDFHLTFSSTGSSYDGSIQIFDNGFIVASETNLNMPTDNLLAAQSIDTGAGQNPAYYSDVTFNSVQIYGIPPPPVGGGTVGGEPTPTPSPAPTNIYQTPAPTASSSGIIPNWISQPIEGFIAAIGQLVPAPIRDAWASLPSVAQNFITALLFIMLLVLCAAGVERSRKKTTPPTK